MNICLSHLIHFKHIYDYWPSSNVPVDSIGIAQCGILLRLPQNHAGSPIKSFRFKKMCYCRDLVLICFLL